MAYTAPPIFSISSSQTFRFIALFSIEPQPPIATTAFCVFTYQNRSALTKPESIFDEVERKCLYFKVNYLIVATRWILARDSSLLSRLPPSCLKKMLVLRN
ncbi:unnamed protein product [Arabis nemorensis]|uniref:Uncharacterized protein n=1 Tax=Arabis nemorensis TaxID=586526 RepID=A0A565CXI4_9BRAS|nr:unnamed protein product [Arabis nemorensis]